MFTILLLLMILLGIGLIVVVLLQAGKGGGLAAMGGGSGTDTFVGGRQAATILTKATWMGGGLFLFLALTLSIMSSRQRGTDSILQEEFRQTAPAAPQPVLPGASETPTEESQPQEEDAGTPPPVEPDSPIPE